MKLFAHEVDDASKTLVIIINTPKFDASVCGDFTRYAEDLLDEQWQAIVLDIGAVTFIDSSGVGALLSVQKNWNQPEKSIILRGATPTVKSIIELLRLQRVFTLQEG